MNRLEWLLEAQKAGYPRVAYPDQARLAAYPDLLAVAEAAQVLLDAMPLKCAWNEQIQLGMDRCRAALAPLLEKAEEKKL